MLQRASGRAFHAHSPAQKQRAFFEFRYATNTWHTERRMIARLEHGDQGENPRFIVTKLVS